MKKINILKNGIITNSAKFETQVELDKWFEKEKLNKSFGENERDEAIFDVDGKTIIDTIHHEAEYTVEILDITAEVEQQRINTEALQYLANTDYLIIRQMDSGVLCPEEIKQLRAEARARIV